MNLVDSSCWLEYLSGSKIGNQVAAAIEDIKNVIVPSIVLYEVFKKMLIETDEDKAFFVIAQMKQGIVVDLDSELAIYSAKTSKEHKLPMADSIIYSITKKTNAILWTQDKHFKGLESVKYLGKE